MKKTITKKDGTTVVVEGTAEELAEYEKKLKKEPLQEEPSKPGLLKGKSFQELMEEAWKKQQQDEWKKWYQPYFQPVLQHASNCEIIVAQRGWWSVVPPRCTCGLYVYPNDWYTIITTTSGDSINTPQKTTVTLNGGVTIGAVQ